MMQLEEKNFLYIISECGSVFFIGSDIDELIYCHIIANNSIRVNY